MDEIRSRDNLPAFFRRQGYKIGAEIGVYKGEFSKKLMDAGLRLIGIDPYQVYGNYRKHPQEPNYEGMFQEVSKLYDRYPGCRLLRWSSEDALEVGKIADNSLDFVYIDGNHALPYVAEDIYGWYRKVRPGGAISGHDYYLDNHNPYWIRACHVKLAVDACVQIFRVKNLQVIGTHDRRPSWLWIKEE